MLLQELEWREKQYDLKVWLRSAAWRYAFAICYGWFARLSTPLSRTQMQVITDVHGEDGSVLVHKALTYVGSADSVANEFWGGTPPAAELAEQIAAASGLSGPNYEYLYRLADGLRAMHVHDAHVFALERQVREIRGDAAAPTSKGCYRE